MLKIIIALFILIFTANFAYSQIDDIFEKVKKEVKKIPLPKDDTSSTKTKKPDSKTNPSGDNNYVSEYHKLHKGEISFCADKDPDMSKEINFSSSFSEKEDVTACVYLEKHIKHYTTSSDVGTANSYYVSAKVDGEDLGIVFDDHLRSGDVNAISIRVLGSGGIITNGNDWGNRVIKMSPGEHKVYLEVWGGGKGYSTSTPIAKGEFTFIKDVPPPEKVYGRWSDVKAGMHNANLEQQAIDAVNQKAANENWKERYTKAVITSYDWETRRNEWTGIITGRAIYMTLYGVWPDGKCRKVDFGFWEDYNGSSYSSYLQYNGIGDMWLIECE